MRTQNILYCLFHFRKYKHSANKTGDYKKCQKQKILSPFFSPECEDFIYLIKLQKTIETQNKKIESAKSKGNNNGNQTKGRML